MIFDSKEEAKGDMNNYPLEKQVCSLEQAKKLAGLLGEDAPGSVWGWVKLELWGWLILRRLKAEIREYEYYPAYTGDEFGALFKNAAKWNEYPCYNTAQEKAALAIEGLEEGWIKKEEFKYENAL